MITKEMISSVISIKEIIMRDQISYHDKLHLVALITELEILIKNAQISKD